MRSLLAISCAVLGLAFLGGCSDDPSQNAESKSENASTADMGDASSPRDAANSATTDATNVPDGAAADTGTSTCPEIGPAQVYAVRRASYALDACGRLWGWGEAVVSSPDATTPSVHPSAIQIAPESRWLDFSPGRISACGIQIEGSLWCWGSGPTGELGLGDIMYYVEPQRLGTESDWFAIDRAAFPEIVCALRGAGEMWCWGSNRNGMLDDTTTDPVTAPRRIGTDDDWTEVAVAADNICGLKEDASLWCWGANSSGQLGIGTIGEFGVLEPPTQVPGSWIAVDALSHSICGVKEGGSLQCWGAAGGFYVPDGSAELNQPDPIEIDPGSRYVQVSLPGPLALRDDGTIVHHNFSEYGPIDGTDWANVASGKGDERDHQCASNASGEVFCRGHNSRGQVGVGTSSTRWEPVRLGDDASWRALDGELSSTCAVNDEGLFCWGASNVDVPASPTGGQSPTATPAPEVLTTVAPGLFHRCAVGASGALYCIGNNGFGQLGIGQGVFPTPGEWARVGVEADWSTVHVAWERTCGIRSGELWCWGAGIGYEPVQIGADSDWEAITADRLGTLFCGLRAGDLWCYDGAVLSQIGAVGGFESVAVGRVTASSGPMEVCGIGAAGELMCAQVGGEPTRQGTESWRSVALGDTNGFCGVLRSGEIGCVNMSDFYAGRGNPQGSGGAILDDTDWIDLKRGDSHFCATKGGDGTQGELYCWGEGARGETGTGDAYFPEFQRVLGF